LKATGGSRNSRRRRVRKKTGGREWEESRKSRKRVERE
jgi:hypothetical protein